MHILLLKAAPISGENSADSGGFYISRYAYGCAYGKSYADGDDLERMVRVFFAGTGSTECRGKYDDDNFQFLDESGGGDFDDIDAAPRLIGWPVSRFHLCEDYASGFHVEFPDRHAGVDGWDGGVHTYYRRPDWEYDRDDTEREPNDTK